MRLIMKNIYKILADKPMGSLNALELNGVIEYTAKRAGMQACDLMTLKHAIDLATLLHRNHIRKNRDACKNTPYIEHPLRNTLRIMRWGCFDINILSASMLHDVVEDSSALYCNDFLHKDVIPEGVAQEQLLKYIRKNFNVITANTVKSVTNPIDLNASPTKNADYLEHVKTNIHNNKLVFYVKFSDFVDNAIGLKHGGDDKFIKRQAKKYQPMIDIYLKEISNLIVEGHIEQKMTEDMVFKLEYAKIELKNAVND